MGYTTEFEGSFTITPKLSAECRKYLARFSETRRVKRDVNKLLSLPDPLREKMPLGLGIDGEFFVGEPGTCGTRAEDSSIVDYNVPPSTQPGLWCQWIPTHDGKELAWDGGEKFYNYIEWLQYLVDNFFAPYGYKLNGQVKWAGEDRDDVGVITVVDNIIYADGKDNINDEADVSESAKAKASNVWIDSYSRRPSDVDFPVWVCLVGSSTPRVFYTNKKLGALNGFKWTRAVVPEAPEEKVFSVVVSKMFEVVAHDEVEARQKAAKTEKIDQKYISVCKKE